MAGMLWNVFISILWIALGLFGLLLLFVLVVPCRYLVEGQYAGSFDGSVKLRMWPFTFCKKFNKGQSDLKGNKAKNEAKVKAKSKEKGGRLGPKLLLCQEKAVMGSLLDLVGNLWRKVRPRTLRLEGTFGFADPYYTGMMAAAVSAIRLPGLQLQPDFSQPGFCGNIYIEGHFYVVVVIYLLGKTVFTRPLRPVLWKYLKKKRGGISVGS